jgi:sporulation protein YlmC with PRC-barrel domain
MQARTQGEFLTQMPVGATRVSKLIGVEVIGSDIHRLGDVSDVVLDRNGAIKAVVIGMGGVLGVGAKHVAVPFQALLLDYDVSPTSPPSSSNTGETAAPGGGIQAQRATAPRPDTPPETTGTVGNPSLPGEGLRVQGSTTAVTGSGAPQRAVLRMTLNELRNAPDFQPSR